MTYIHFINENFSNAALLFEAVVCIGNDELLFKDKASVCNYVMMWYLSAEF